MVHIYNNNRITQPTISTIQKSSSKDSALLAKDISTTEKLDSLLAGTNENTKKLDDILEQISQMTKKEAKEDEARTGAFSIICGMLLGGIGTHITTGGQFDLINTGSMLGKFLGTKYGKFMGAIIATTGIGLGIFGMKKLCESMQE